MSRSNVLRIGRARLPRSRGVSPVAVPPPAAPAVPVPVVSPASPAAPYIVSESPIVSSAGPAAVATAAPSVSPFVPTRRTLAGYRPFRAPRVVYGSSHTPADRAVEGQSGMLPYEDATQTTGQPAPTIASWPAAAASPGEPLGEPAAPMLAGMDRKTVLILGGLVVGWFLMRRKR